ncbi:uncharacterized protein BDW43DRAFT_271333 [Aspergillus alliaceus]|uniref:uncharacterized protein n=1 Tax=Petromyces alliaceus TaxID=209559 RepID=UPI0012A55CAE|nr:uncharacterized protein BDW43DRAFT_271333 [Aspergillus alliaceus]KAB8235223.1 hypothetical protein BDW43DRAFT_271333 [Aspergillus alliaceus]
MRPGDKSLPNAKTSDDQFRTPNKPAGPTTTSDSLRGTSAAEKRIETPASSDSTFRSWKRTSFASARDQPTLTQIDFVTLSQPQSDDDDDLDYIGDAPKKGTRKSREVIEIADDSGNDADYRPSEREQAPRTRGVKFDHDTSNPASKNKMTRQNDGPSKRGRKKSGDGAKGVKKGKEKQQKDKTLTQMDYVRRYLKIEPYEDVKLEYTYTTPQKHERKSHSVQPPNTGDAPRTAYDTHASSSESKRRKLNESRSNEKPEVTEDHKEHQSIGGPVTPRKFRKSEIPSSQSPESPGLAIISSSQFRGATRSPLKRASLTPIFKRTKEESPSCDIIKRPPQSPVRTLIPHDTPPPMMPHSPLSSKHISKEILEINAYSTQSPSTKGSITPKDTDKAGGEELHERPTTTQRTVIYETDADTDSGDLQDDEFNIPGSPSEKVPADQYHTHEEKDDDDDDVLLNEDSQDLPPIPQSGLDIESGPLQSETNLPSDASIYYRRPQQATQFPLEPVPTINTQKWAELFPDDQLESTAVSRLQSSAAGRIPHRPSLHTQTQTQTQTQSQEPDKASTEIVPESSPIVCCESGDLPRAPATRESVVQVESSQPADRFHRKADTDRNPQPRGILSTSQLLTSSVMESITLPMFLLGSQDSIGEPYSDT